MKDTAYQLFPPLSADEFRELKADIAERGVMVAVEYDDDGNILDGHHRVQAWTELVYEGVSLEPYPRVVREGLTEAEKRAHVRRLNILRRHLTQEQKRALIRDQVRETPDRSNRQVARDLGVSHVTVGAVRTDLETTGQIDQSDERRGADGRVINTAKIGQRPPVRRAADPDIFDDYVEDANQDYEEPTPQAINVEPAPLQGRPKTVDLSSLNLPPLEPTKEEKAYHSLVMTAVKWADLDPDAVAEVTADDGWASSRAEPVERLANWLHVVAAKLRARGTRGIRAVK